MVAEENGQKRIDEIEVGDKVWAYNVETGETELKSVTKVYVHSVDEILHLYTDEGDIDTTANHPFYVMGKGWVAAGDLAEGDKVYNLDGAVSVVFATETEKLDDPVLVYNLEVEDFHSYFVGCVPVLVHNKCTKDDLFSWQARNGSDDRPGGGRPYDFKVGSADDAVGPYPDANGNVKGASSYAKKGDAKLSGNCFKLPAGTVLPDGIDVVNDGPKSHNTFYPTTQMTINEFNEKFWGMGWIKE